MILHFFYIYIYFKKIAQRTLVNKSNINLRKGFNNRFIVLIVFTILIIFLGIYHTIESVKNPPLASTDKNVYQVEESITLKIENGLPERIRIDNCDSFEVETKTIDGSWENISNSLICKQEEVIIISSDKEAFFNFISIKPGTFRIHVNYKVLQYPCKFGAGESYTPVYRSVLHSNDFKVN